MQQDLLWGPFPERTPPPRYDSVHPGRLGPYSFEQSPLHVELRLHSVRQYDEAVTTQVSVGLPATSTWFHAE